MSRSLLVSRRRGVLLAFAGVAWAFSEGFSEPAAGPSQWIGDGLGLLGGALWGATTLAVRGSPVTSATSASRAASSARTSAVSLSGW